MNKTKILIECACGCTNMLPLLDKRGRLRRFIHGHNQQGKHWGWAESSRKEASKTHIGKHTGSNNGRWKGGRYIDTWGYVWVLCPLHPYATDLGYVREHRLVIEQILGRFLLPSETPHHINGIKNDNRPENLTLFPHHSKHMKEAHGCNAHV